MTNPYYDHTTYPNPNAPGASAALRAELNLIEAGFGKLPTLAGNANKLVVVNGTNDGLIAVSVLPNLSVIDSTFLVQDNGDATKQFRFEASGITAGATRVVTVPDVNLTLVGLDTIQTLTNKTLTAPTINTGVLAGGTIDNAVIGGTTAAAGTFTSLSASSATVGGSAVVTLAATQTLTNKTISGGTVTGAVVTGLSAPSGNSDAATKSYVDTADALKLNLSGGTMSGAIAMGGSLITGLGAPTNTGDATRKSYVDSADALKLDLAGGTMSGNLSMNSNKVTNVGTPTADNDAANKAYVDSLAQGLDIKASVRAATTANVTLSGTQTIDGVALGAGDRVLVKNQSTASQNGIYVVSAGSWTRSSDMDVWTEFPGSFFFVEDGTDNDNSGWVCTVAPGGTVGSTSVTFEQFSGAGQITAGAGLTKTGNTLDVGTASTARIVVNADNIDLATTGVSAGTYRSVTVDAYGRVTAGTAPTTISGYGITDAYTKTEVDNALGLKLNLSGGTMSGNITMGGNTVTGLGAPVNSSDAATKTYVDTADNLKLNLSGGTMSGAIAMGTNKITGLGDPTANQDAVTLNYVTTLYGSTASAAVSAADALTYKNAAESAATTATTQAGTATSAASTATTQAGIATTQAGLATTAANNAEAAWDQFDDRYLGAKSSPPIVDNDGNPLVTGALYFDSSANKMRVYTGSAWIDAGSAVNGTSARAVYTATAGQTSFAITYDIGFVDVYLNGLKLEAGVDFTATNGTSVVLASGATAGDVIDMVSYGSFLVANTYTQAQTDSLLAAKLSLTGGTMTGAITFAGGQTFPGTGDVTLTGTQTLTNKTLSTGTTLGADVTGGDFLLTRTMFQDTGWDYFDQGDTNSSGTTTLNYTNGSVQRWAPSGTRTLATSNWPPSGALGELLVEGINLGAATLTWPTVNWVKSDGTTTTTFSANGVTLQSSGTDWFLLWTRDAGTTIYGKFLR